MEHPHPTHTLVQLAIGLGVLAVSLAVADDGAPPTPTPRPGTLAALAGSTRLARDGATESAEPVVITNDNLEALGRNAAITVLTSTIAEPPEPSSVRAVDPKIRAKWRRRVLAQSKVIARLETRRDAVASEIDRLGRGRLDARTLDRIEKAEARRRQVDAEIAGAKAELSRIVRDARKEGAQPGWFR